MFGCARRAFARPTRISTALASAATVAMMATAAQMGLGSVQRVLAIAANATQIRTLRIGRFFTSVYVLGDFITAI